MMLQPRGQGEVVMRLAWDRVDVKVKNRSSKLEQGGKWMLVRVDRPLTEVEEKIRVMFQCTKPYNQLHIHLQDGQGRTGDFISDHSLEQLRCRAVRGGCGGEEFTVVCTALHNLDETWSTFRPDGALLQAAGADMVGLTVRWHQGDFVTEPPVNPWRTVWGMATTMQGLEAFLRAQLVLRDQSEVLFIVVKDEEGRHEHFYSCLTPKALRLTPNSYIYCIGLKRRDEVGERIGCQAKLSWQSWHTEAKARFGEEAAEQLLRETEMGDEGEGEVGAAGGLPTARQTVKEKQDLKNKSSCSEGKSEKITSQESRKEKIKETMLAKLERKNAIKNLEAREYKDEKAFEKEVEFDLDRVLLEIEGPEKVDVKKKKKKEQTKRTS